MKENKLDVKIAKPVNEVFDFTINPKNTPKWVDAIELEETNEWPIKIGTKYRNKGKSGEWSEYVVTALEPNKLFEIKMLGSNYHTRYTYEEFGSETKLEYYEWVEEGEIKDPFVMDTLDKLKEILESE